MSLTQLNTDSELNTFEELHPLILFTKANASDNLTWYQAMNGPHKDEFWEATQVENYTLERMIQA